MFQVPNRCLGLVQISERGFCRASSALKKITDPKNGNLICRANYDTWNQENIRKLSLFLYFKNVNVENVHLLKFILVMMLMMVFSM